MLRRRSTIFVYYNYYYNSYISPRKPHGRVPHRPIGLSAGSHLYFNKMTNNSVRRADHESKNPPITIPFRIFDVCVCVCVFFLFSFINIRHNVIIPSRVIYNVRYNMRIISIDAFSPGVFPLVGLRLTIRRRESNPRARKRPAGGVREARKTRLCYIVYSVV